jgi:hypothetical protein
MDYQLFKKLHAEGLLSDESFEKIAQKNLHPLFSVFWEIKTLLYIGIVLLTSGLGILVYKNIDTIGHQVVLLFIALVSTGCFFYCFKYRVPFTKTKVKSPNAFFDFILLLAATSFLIFVGYLQYQYNVFGNHYGMATLIPMLVLFYIAYYFDHIGILAMAIANLGIWLGVSVTPKQLLLSHTFNSATIIYTYIGFGLLLLTFAWITEKYNFKKHFKFSYQHYGIHVSFISLIAGYSFYYSSNYSVAFLFALLGIAFIVYTDAFKDKSFYFLLLVVLYSYIAVTCLLIRCISSAYYEAVAYFFFMYFISSALGLVFLLINLNKKLKTA